MEYPWKLQTAALADVESLSYEVAVLPIGATEPHGRHLPFGTDAMHATYVAENACRAANREGAKTICLPTIPYGVDVNMLAFPFAMNVSQATLNRVVLDIAESLECHGIRKLVIVNGHGGNEFKSLLRERTMHKGLFMCLIDWWMTAEDIGETLFENGGDHGNEMETSVMLHLFPDLVHMENAGTGETRETDFEAINRGWVKISRPWHLLTADSTCGDPRKSDAEKGERYLSLAVGRIAQFLRQLSAVPKDENFPYSRTIKAIS